MTGMILLLSLGIQDASAWAHTTRVWNREDIGPLTWFLSTREDETIEYSAVGGELDRSFQNWVEAAPCAALSTEYKGEKPMEENWKLDGRVFMVLDDPNEEDWVDRGSPGFNPGMDTGVLAATVCFPTTYARTFQGENYYYTEDCDIAFNSEIDWTTRQEFDDGLCNGGTVMESVATHEIGHLWGLGHSCNDPQDNDPRKGPDACDDELKAATMFWQAGPCSLEQATIEADDIEGLYALYGPYCEFTTTEAEGRVAGGAPFEVCFDYECSEDPSGFVWEFGDGETSSEGSPCHTYTEKGQYSVVFTASGGGDADSACPTWSAPHREASYVLVCGQPEPAEGFTGLFTYENDVGNTLQFVNQTDTTVYGCVDSVEWDVYEGGGEIQEGDEPVQRIDAWSPKIDFGKAGTYRVVLNVGGPGGESAGELVVNVGDYQGGSCSTTPNGASRTGLYGMLVGLAAMAWRRRSRA